MLSLSQRCLVSLTPTASPLQIIKPKGGKGLKIHVPDAGGGAAKKVPTHWGSQKHVPVGDVAGLADYLKNIFEVTRRRPPLRSSTRGACCCAGRS